MDMTSNFLLLHDQAVECFGYKFFGTAWQPEFGDWAFGLPRGQACRTAYESIPDDTEVLVTHTPCVGYGDFCRQHLGCVDLLHRVVQIKPKYHLFGHIHEGYSATTSSSNSVWVSWLVGWLGRVCRDMQGVWFGWDVCVVL